MAKETLKKYRVRPNRTVTVGRVNEETGTNETKEYKANEVVELTEAEAAALLGHTVEEGERRKGHAGQLTRAERQIEKLTEQVEAQKEYIKLANTKLKPKDLEELKKSFIGRGDNFIGRGEADPNRTPTGFAEESQYGADEGANPVSDEQMEDLTGGMHGMSRAHAPAGGAGSSTANSDNK